MSVDRRQSGSRTYAKLSIGQLEGIFAGGRVDPEVLAKLDHELGFRDAPRATRLRTRIGKARAGLPHPAPKPATRVAPKRATGSGRRQPPITRPDNDAASIVSPAAPIDTRTASAVLSAWTALEALTPQTYRRPEDLAAGDRGAVAELRADGPLPWESGETPRRGQRLYYLVVLGSISVSKAVEQLATAFGEDEETSPRLREKAAIAAVLVDQQGMMIDDGGVSVSSFAWALPQALRRKLDRLGAWPEVEPEVVRYLGGVLRGKETNGMRLPLDRARIQRAHRWLAKEFGLPADLVQPPSFSIRITQSIKARHHPDAALLNSFFLGDLTRAKALVEAGRAPAGLRQYLGLESPREVVDLLTDHGALEAAVAPSAMPLARWPHPGGHSLVLLQQAAVNLARSELAAGEGLIAVNGPPGTGKTTLLRDLVAASVLDRALAMATFDDPNEAFTFSGESMAAGETAAFKIYRLVPSLKGHEVVVASSNNKAVENISRELPALKAIGREGEEFGYFRTLGAQLQRAAAAREPDGEEGSPAAEPAESWGMIAAVLGNRRNLAAFQQAFWWDNERSFRVYLKAAKGDGVSRETRDPKTGTPGPPRLPVIVEAERPPIPADALAAWHTARQRLLALRQEVAAEIDGLETVRRLCLDLGVARCGLTETDARSGQLVTEQRNARADRSRAADFLAASRCDHDRARSDEAASRAIRPGILQRLFGTAAWKAWASTHAPLAQAAVLTARRCSEAERGEEEVRATLAGLSVELKAQQSGRVALAQKEAGLAGELDRHRPALGNRVVDAVLLAGDREQAHKTSPWLADTLQRKREDLFAAALETHRAFMNVAARKVYGNLGALMEVFANGVPQDEARRKLVGDLWSTLHLAVPVVSTTFASVDRMLGAIPPGSIGWLLIDEGGQAHPQAAAGAITRARRTVVVGDPLQVRPVVPTPERLTADLCRHFNVDRAFWAAPKSSAQTIADRNSRFQAAFRSAHTSRRVGIPLLVHRRCQAPMFGMFNRIAYDQQMVQATTPRGDCAIAAVLGASHWLDVAGDAESKWRPAEGEAVVRMLRTLADAGVTKPDLFIVSPFRIVAQSLRRRLEQERALFAKLEVDPRTWIDDRIGTIHTVQGREANAMVLVLGAPKPSQRRARVWAAETPNVFNVALSRARNTFYVVGSREAWSDVGHGQELATLPLAPKAPILEEREHKTQPESSERSTEIIARNQQAQHRRGPAL